MTYTPHGHHVPGTDVVDVEDRPPVARCGGIALCGECSRFAQLAAPDLGQPLERQEYPEMVNHPQHYNESPSGVECIDVVEHMNFNVGNAMKYLWRADHKNGLEDLKKARWYIDREIQRLKKDPS